MTKEELAAAMAAFEHNGGEIKEVPPGATGNPDPLRSTLKYCNCGCGGDWTDHTMRLGESGR